MADLDEVINAAIDKAEGKDEVPAAEEYVGEVEVEEDGGEPGPGERTEEGEPEVEAAPASKTEETKVEEPPAEAKVETAPKESAEDAEITKLLEEHGIKAPKKGQRDNPIPYSRTRKIIGNALKKIRTSQGEEIKTRDTKITDYEGQLSAVNRTNQLIATDADRYILTLAALYPEQYGKFVKGGTIAAPAAAATVDDKNDPEPQADLRYDDGTVGYSPEQWQKLREWDRRSATRAAVAEAEKRFGPMERSFRSANERAQAMPRYQAEVERVRALYGDPKDPNNPFTLDEQKAGQNGDAGQSEILAYMRQHSEFDARGRVVYRPSLAEAAAAVLLPKIHAAHTEDINKRRADWIAESKRRPNASQTPPRASKPAEKTPKPGERDLEDVIEASLQRAGL